MTQQKQSHAVLTEKNAKKVKDFLLKGGRTIQRISVKRERIVLNVTALEDKSKQINFIVDIIEVNQERSSNKVAHLKGRTHFDHELISNLHFFRQEDLD